MGLPWGLSVLMRTAPGMSGLSLSLGFWEPWFFKLNIDLMVSMDRSFIQITRFKEHIINSLAKAKGSMLG